MSRRILILGAGSAIAREVAAAFAQQGDQLFLAGRHLDDLKRVATDLTTRFNASVNTVFFDALAFDTHQVVLAHVLEQFGELDGIVVAFGYMTNPKTGSEFAECQKIIDSNLTGAVSIINHCADYFMQKKAGFIIAISSVAGDRGRSANYTYGAAKAGLSVYLQGLRQRLFPYNVRVITIKPGYVDTPMTYGHKGLFLVADPKSVGKKIANSLNGKLDIVYLPWFWRYLMYIVRLIPETIFKRLKI